MPKKTETTTTTAALTATPDQLEAMRNAFRRVEAADKNVETAKQQKKDKDGDLVAAQKELHQTVNAIVGTPELPFASDQDGE